MKLKHVKPHEMRAGLYIRAYTNSHGEPRLEVYKVYGVPYKHGKGARVKAARWGAGFYSPGYESEHWLSDMTGYWSFTTMPCMFRFSSKLLAFLTHARATLAPEDYEQLVSGRPTLTVEQRLRNHHDRY